MFSVPLSQVLLLQVSFDEVTPTSITSTKVLSGGSFEVEFSGGLRLMGAGGQVVMPLPPSWLLLDTGITLINQI